MIFGAFLFDGSLINLGTLDRNGSLAGLGTFKAIGSLLLFGTLSTVGSLDSDGSFKELGSLIQVGTLGKNGSLQALRFFRRGRLYQTRGLTHPMSPMSRGVWLS